MQIWHLQFLPSHCCISISKKFLWKLLILLHHLVHSTEDFLEKIPVKEIRETGHGPDLPTRCVPVSVQATLQLMAAVCGLRLLHSRQSMVVFAISSIRRVRNRCIVAVGTEGNTPSEKSGMIVLSRELLTWTFNIQEKILASLPSRTILPATCLMSDLRIPF